MVIQKSFYKTLPPPLRCLWGSRPGEPLHGFCPLGAGSFAWDVVVTTEEILLGMWKLQVSCKCALQLVWAGYCSRLELKVHACVLNGVRLFVTPWTVARQVPLSVEFSRQEFWSGLPFPTPGHLPDPGIELTSLVHASLRGGFFTTVPHGKPSTLSVPLFKNSCV